MVKIRLCCVSLIQAKTLKVTANQSDNMAACLTNNPDLFIKHHRKKTKVSSYENKRY